MWPVNRLLNGEAIATTQRSNQAPVIEAQFAKPSKTALTAAKPVTLIHALHFYRELRRFRFRSPFGARPRSHGWGLAE